jgi:hypothetical protein
MEDILHMACDVENTATVFRFRLRNVRTGKATLWCSYQMHCYLDGYVAATQYYLPQSHECRPLTADEFCKLTASGIKE